MSSNFDNTIAGKASEETYAPLLQKLQAKTFESLLDVGCGTGRFLSLVKDKFHIEVSGIDLSEGMITQANKLLGQQADLKVGDSEHLPWDNNSFDIITCNASFHHYPNPMGVLREMNRVLKQRVVL